MCKVCNKCGRVIFGCISFPYCKAIREGLCQNCDRKEMKSLRDMLCRQSEI